MATEQSEIPVYPSHVSGMSGLGPAGLENGPKIDLQRYKDEVMNKREGGGNSQYMKFGKLINNTRQLCEDIKEGTNLQQQPEVKLIKYKTRDKDGLEIEKTSSLDPPGMEVGSPEFSATASPAELREELEKRNTTEVLRENPVNLQ